MASIVLSSIGSSVGNALLPGVGGRILAAAGRKLGAPLDDAIGWSEASSASDGKRLENFKVQDSRYGLAIPVSFGAVRVAGNVIWVSDLIETQHKEDTGLGKGGGMTGSSRNTYSYCLHVAVALGEGPIGDVRTIWADNKVIFQDGVWKAGLVGAASLYKGSLDQAVDPLMESYLGSGNVPAYPALAYLVIESLQLASFGNRLPNLTFEIVPEKGAQEPLMKAGDDLACLGDTLSAGGMTPIALEASGAQVRSVLCGGYVLEAGQARFVACEMGLSDEAPVVTNRVLSGAFAVTDCGSVSWAVDSAGRYVVYALQDNDAGCSLWLALYDTQKHEFGDALRVSCASGEKKQVVWLDALHFAVMDVEGGLRGARVFMRVGSRCGEVGFYNVWGSASRYGLGYAQFMSVGGRCVCVAGGAATGLAKLYFKSLTRGPNGGWSVGSEVVLDGPVGAAYEGGTLRFVQTGESEVSLCWATGSSLSVMSLGVGAAGVSVLRGWKRFDFSGDGVFSALVPVWNGAVLRVFRKSYWLGEIDFVDCALEADGFGSMIAARGLAGAYHPPASFDVVKMGGGRFLLAGGGLDGTVGSAFCGLIDKPQCDMADVVSVLLSRAGYAAGDFDVSELVGVALDGFVLSDGDTLVSALGWLQAFEPFDLVERDGVLKACRRGGVSIAQIEEADLVAGEDEGALQILRARELSLPVELTLDTLDAERDYEIGTQRGRRLVAAGGARAMQVSLPLVCGAGTAKRIAERMLYALWAERTGYAFGLPYSYGWLQAGDVVDVAGRRMRLVRMDRKGGVWKVSAVSALGDGVASSAVAEVGSGGAGVSAAGESRLYVMDLPALRAADDTPGFYAAVSTAGAWRGAALWRSADGADYTQKVVFESAATAGYVVKVPSDKVCDFIDMESKLKVQLYRGELASLTLSQMLAGGNAALCGGEILQFQKAELIGDGLYELSGLLRGRKGSEAGAANHQVGEDFVLLSESAVQFVACPAEERGRSFFFRALSGGQSLGSADDQVATLEMRTLRPLAPVQVRGVRAGGDLTLSWSRRARINGSWCDFVDVPLDETQELYDVEILKNGDVIRTLSGLGESRVVYTAAMQSADFGSAQTAVTVRVYQVSPRYGRGDAATATI